MTDFHDVEVERERTKQETEKAFWSTPERTQPWSWPEATYRIILVLCVSAVIVVAIIYHAL